MFLDIPAMTHSLHTHSDASLVLVSIFAAILASYVSLDLVQRSLGVEGGARRALIGVGGLTMGLGIWSMHFIGMASVQMPMSVSYDPLLLALSLLAAVVGSVVALGVVTLREVTMRSLLSAAAFMGTAIAAMHYLGMASMKMEAGIDWNAALVIASLVIAFGASLLALWLVVQIGSRRLRLGFGRRWIAALVLGLGISGMHYTAMAAVTYTQRMGGSMDEGSVGGSSLLVLLAIGAAVTLIVLIGGAASDQRRATAALDLARVSELSRGLIASAEPRTDACAALRELCKADLVALIEFDEHRELHLTAADGAAPDAIALLADPATAGALASGERRYVARPDGIAADGLGLEALQYEPLLVRQKARGAFLIGWRERRHGPPSERLVSGIGMLAAEAGAAIERTDLVERLDFLARRDELTGLVNRRVLQEELEREVDEAARSGRPLAVLMLDLDSFKQINDAQGHRAGDRLLKATAAAWTETLRAGGVIARFGGDELAAVLPGTDLAAALAVGERLRGAVPPPATCSIGVAVLAPGQSAAQLLNAADDRLYAAKRGGRDRVESRLDTDPAAL
jgi:diguanylate cyclase